MEHYVNVMNCIHNQLPAIEGGLHSEEFIEQIMCAIALGPYDRVLELGGSIGRCSRTIASIVRPGNLVVLEPRTQDAVIARRNRDSAGLSYSILNIALSNVPLIWSEWRTYPFNPVIHREADKVNTVSWEEFKKCHEPFTALVADCEGALTKIIEENPTFLDGFLKITIESDFATTAEKQRFEKLLLDRNFVCVFSLGEVNNSPGFYRVWVKQFTSIYHVK